MTQEERLIFWEVKVSVILSKIVYMHIFENSTVNINALCNSCEDMACCLSVQCSVLYSEISLISQTVRNRTHVHMQLFLLRMTVTVTSQNIDVSSWDTLCLILAKLCCPKMEVAVSFKRLTRTVC
jgi:hypothetical protein